MASLPKRLQNSSYNANELQGVGMSPPPTVSPNVQGDFAMFNTASPLLRKTTLVDNSSMLNTAAKCREYTGFDGLRRLQNDQKNSTYYDPGCGWMYKQGSGTTNPSVNRGVFATYNGVPAMGGRGQPDELVGGSITMDLQRAEQRASKQIAAGLGGGCTSLGLLSASNAPYFGFCTTTNKIIPIDNSSGTPQARYNNSTNFQFNCASSNIITAERAARPGGCPVGPRVTVTAAPPVAAPIPDDIGRRPLATEARPEEPVAIPVRPPPPPSILVAGSTTYREGFDNSDNLQSQFACQVPLTRDCLLQGVRNAGCTDKGSLVAALSANSNLPTYDSALNGSTAYKYYASKTNLPTSLFKDGTGVPSSQNAYDIFTALAAAAETTSSNPMRKGVHAAARDLCLQSGSFSNSYNFCAELTGTTRIDSTNIACIQNLWRNAGGDSRGTSYPKISEWQGKTVDSFTQFKNTLVANLKSTNKATQANAIMQFIGTATYAVQPSCDLTQVANTRGSETVWFYNGNAGFPVIMRCDLMMAKDSDVIPDFTVPDALNYKYALGTPNFVSFTTAFEYRPTANNKLAFQLTVDDCAMIGYNQNPFEGTNNLDWGSWRAQGATTTYTSGTYTINATAPGSRNMFVIKYGQSAGSAAFRLSIAEDYTAPRNFVNVATSVPAKQNIYLTQEPLAPWMNYEVCTKPNMGLGPALGFFDTRWNGPTAAPTVSGNTKISFDTSSSGVVYQTSASLRSKVPGGKCYMSFTESSGWMTRGLFSYSAFKTLTIMVRPTVGERQRGGTGILKHSGRDIHGFTLGVNDGVQGSAVVFILVTSRDGKILRPENAIMQTAPCVMNAWNLVVIQYIDTDGYGIRDISLHACSYEAASLNPTVRAEMLTQMQAKRNATSPIRMPVSRKESDITKYAGFLRLGTGSGAEGPSFTGDIAWLHGFRNYIGTDSELDAEINQEWISRWAVPKYNTTVAPDPSGCGPMPAKNTEGAIQPPMPPVVVNTVAAIIYEHCDRTGWSKGLNVGTYEVVKPGSPNIFPDNTSFIDVKSGYIATIATGPNGTGRTKTIAGPGSFNFCSEDLWANDKVRSIIVTQPGATISGNTSTGVGGTIQVINADYGTNCGVAPGYLTNYFKTNANGKQSLKMPTTPFNSLAGDPKVGCPKNFSLTYKCGDNVSRTVTPVHSPQINENYSLDISCTQGTQGFRNQYKKYEPKDEEEEPKSVAASFFELFKW